VLFTGVEYLMKIKNITSLILVTLAMLTNYVYADNHNESLSEQEKQQLQCMTENVYREAGSEIYRGKIAVAQVVMNRVESGNYPADPCKVIYQTTSYRQKVVCQFSWVCEKRKPVSHSSNAWLESKEAAAEVLLHGFRLSNLTKVYHFHSIYVNPGWKKANAKTVKIGNHIFYARPRKQHT
jgi:spore germination cell wall hydrolase CwlJ-like protein